MSRPRTCAWCTKTMPAGKRSHAVTCSKRCRQARARFRAAIAPETAPEGLAGSGFRLAYADPPYPGLAQRYYGEHPDYDGEVDHAQLVEQLLTYDGWALSTSAEALPSVLDLCPADVRVAAWHRSARPHAEAIGPLNAWEPVIYSPPRRPRRHRLAAVAEVSPSAARDTSRPGYRDASREVLRDTSTPANGDTSGSSTRDTSPLPSLLDASEEAPTDSLIYAARRRATDPAWVTGAKPAAFARWMFDLLGATTADTLDDLFPGSGGIARAWTMFTGADLVAVGSESLA